MNLYRFRFTHIALCTAALSLGISLGKLFFDQYGSYIDGTNTLRGTFLTGFLDGFFLTLAPLLLLLTLSVTVYASPVSLGALIFECAQDTYYILSAVAFVTAAGAGAVLPCLFFAFGRGFFTYCYLLIALRTLHYRSKTRLLPSTLSTVFRTGSRHFFRDYTGIAGLACVAGLFTHTVFYFL